MSPEVLCDKAVQSSRVRHDEVQCGNLCKFVTLSRVSRLIARARGSRCAEFPSQLLKSSVRIKLCFIRNRLLDSTYLR